MQKSFTKYHVKFLFDFQFTIFYEDIYQVVKKQHYVKKTIERKLSLPPKYLGQLNQILAFSEDYVIG